MFLQVCVCPQGGGGVVSQHALQVVSQHALQQVSRGGGIPTCLAGGIPTCLAAGLQGGVPALGGGGLLQGGCLLLGRGVWRRHPPTQQTATVEDGTHPTGMHSCSTWVYTQFLTGWCINLLYNSELINWDNRVFPNWILWNLQNLYICRNYYK